MSWAAIANAAKHNSEVVLEVLKMLDQRILCTVSPVEGRRKVPGSACFTQA